MRALLPTLSTSVETPWLTAIGLAAVIHVVAISAVLVTRGEAAVPLPELVMVVELPAGAAPAATMAPAPVEAAEPSPLLPAMVVPRLVAPPVDAPLPRERVALPTPRRINPQLASPAPRPSAVPPAATAAVALRPVPVAPAPAIAPGGGPGTSPEAQAAEADWYSLISAHLERSKRYPREAKQAEQQGTPVVRFAVDRRGRVSDVSIARSSGHLLLDRATLELLRRVAPLPAMPRAMGRDSVVISLPIEYSLSRK